MNQILITKKLYVTPELKAKKKVYKFDFFLSLFIVFILVSAAIYAEYDKSKGEQESQELLSDFNSGIEANKQNDTTIAKNNLLLVVLDDEEVAEAEEGLPEESREVGTLKTEKKSSDLKVQTSKEGGYKYTKIASINIPKINVNYVVIDGQTDSEEETEALLKISPIKFWGPEPNKVGNFCIVGHNYRNTKFFSKVPTLENGDIIEITDYTGKTLSYSVYDKYQVVPEDLSCTSQLTNGKKEITVITCTDDSKERVVVKARAI